MLMSIAGTAVKEGAKAVENAAARSGILSGMAAKAKGLFGVGATTAVAAEGGAAAGAALSNAAGAAASNVFWGSAVGKTVKVAAIAGVAYAAWKGLKWMFGSSEPEQAAPSQAVQMVNAPAMQPAMMPGQGQWVSRVGGQGVRGISPEEIRAQQAAMAGQGWVVGNPNA
jgi:hypothetical protein